MKYDCHFRNSKSVNEIKIGKEINCEEINPWIHGCENHLTWSATSTSSGDGRVILAKFLSFLDHIVDKHENLENPIFNKCAHEEIEPRGLGLGLGLGLVA